MNYPYPIMKYPIPASENEWPKKVMKEVCGIGYRGSGWYVGEHYAFLAIEHGEHVTLCQFTKDPREELKSILTLPEHKNV